MPTLTERNTYCNLPRHGDRVLNSIHVGAAWDADAISFLTHIGITDNSIAQYYNDAVWQLKSAGLWENIYAWYPFIGGTALTNSHNAKAFWLNQATFNGSPTQNWQGCEFTVNTQYMDLGFAPNALSTYDHSASFYCNKSSASSLNRVDFGASNSSTQWELLFIYSFSTSLGHAIGGAQAFNSTFIANTPTTALGTIHQCLRSSTNREVYRNGVSIGTGTVGGTLPTSNYRLGLISGLAAPLRRYCDVTIFNKGLTSAQVTAHHRIINQFNTRLNRNY